MEDVLVVLVGFNLFLCLTILGRLASIKAELNKLRRKRIYQDPIKKRAKPPKRTLPL